MESNSSNLTTVFKRMIFQGLEKVDLNNDNQRRAVYEAAARSLEKVHQKNASISPEVKKDQRNVLAQLLEEIESQFLQIADAQKQSSLQVSVDHVDHEDVDAFTEFSEEPKPFAEKLKSIFLMRNIKLLGVLAFGLLLLVLAGLFAFNASEKSAVTADFQLPHVMEADEELFKFVSTKGSVKTELVSGDKTGILYEQKLNPADKTSRFDIILRGELAKNINAITEPIIVTVHLEKITQEPIKLNMLVRASGKVARKKVDITDQKTNEFFIVTNADQGDKPRSNTLFRLSIDVNEGIKDQKAAIIIKKLVLTKF